MDVTRARTTITERIGRLEEQIVEHALACALVVARGYGDDERHRALLVKAEQRLACERRVLAQLDSLDGVSDGVVDGREERQALAIALAEHRGRRQ